jgi:hypothetical protein
LNPIFFNAALTWAGELKETVLCFRHRLHPKAGRVHPQVDQVFNVADRVLDLRLGEKISAEITLLFGLGQRPAQVALGGGGQTGMLTSAVDTVLQEPGRVHRIENVLEPGDHEAGQNDPVVNHPFQHVYFSLGYSRLGELNLVAAHGLLRDFSSRSNIRVAEGGKNAF